MSQRKITIKAPPKDRERIKELLARREDLRGGAAKIQAEIETCNRGIVEINTRRQEMMGHLQATNGAIQDCDHWLEREGYKPPSTEPGNA